MRFSERFLFGTLSQLKIILLIAITITYGKTLDKVDLPNVQSFDGSDDAPKTPPLGTIVVVGEDVSEEQIIDNFVPDATDNERLVVGATAPSHQATSVVIGNYKNDLVKKSREYKETSLSKSQYQILERRPERAEADLERNATILRFDNKNNGDGTYSYAYETENGIFGEESRVADSGVVRGEYSYVGDDGVKYSVRYSADGNGFQAEGDHIPTPPPVPEAILRALEQNARDEAAGIYDDGSYDERKYGGDVNEESAIIFVLSNKLKETKDKSSENDKVAVNASAAPLKTRSEFKNSANLKHVTMI